MPTLLKAKTAWKTTRISPYRSSLRSRMRRSHARAHDRRSVAKSAGESARVVRRPNDSLAACGDVVPAPAGRLNQPAVGGPPDPLIDLLAADLVNVAECLLELPWCLCALALEVAEELMGVGVDLRLRLVLAGHRGCLSDSGIVGPSARSSTCARCLAEPRPRCSRSGSSALRGDVTLGVVKPFGSIEERHGVGGGDEAATEVHEPSSGGDPKRCRAALSAPVVIVLIVAGVAWGIPIVQGFHFGCNVLAGDEVREVRLGFEMCRHRTQAELTEAAEKRQNEERSKAEEQQKRETEERQAHQAQAQKQSEAERPGLEAAAAKLKGDAAKARRNQHQEEGAAKHEQAEAKRLEGEAERVGHEEPEGGDGSKVAKSGEITAQSGEHTAKAGEHESNAGSAKSDAETKEREATEDEGKASGG
jgi:hypothetical protein